MADRPKIRTELQTRIHILFTFRNIPTRDVEMRKSARTAGQRAYPDAVRDRDGWGLCGWG